MRRINWILAAAAVGLTTLAAAGPAAANAPGSPGTPSAPSSVYTEDFEHGVGTSPILLPSYTGAGSTAMTYTADPYYLDSGLCNGLITSYNSTSSAGTSCTDAVHYSWSRGFARALGQVVDPATRDDNHAVIDFTTGGASTANSVQLETNDTAALSGSARFLSFSIDVAEAYCGNGASTHAKLNFFLIDGATEIPAQSSPAVPCTDSNTHNVAINVPNVGNVGFRAGTVSSNEGILFGGSTFGFKVVNTTAVNGANGNDMAFDNVKVLDTTPQLDASFDPAPIVANDTSTLTFTVTNTSELAGKSGWSFSGALPAGVEQVGAAGGTCSADVSTDSGAGTFTVDNGDLAAGTTSCTVTITVTAATAGTYTLQPGDLTVVGLDLPDTADLTVGPVVGVPMVDVRVLGGIGLAGLVVAGGALLVRQRRAVA